MPSGRVRPTTRLDQVRATRQSQGRVPDRTGRSGAEFDSVYGVLEGANEIGITVEEVQSLGLHEVGAEEDVHTLSFIPWPAIRRIRRQR